MKECKVFLKPKKEESLLRFHPWVFSGAIQTIEGEPEEGDLVEVYGTNGRFLGIGHYQIGSIAVRILSFKPVTIDAAFWEERIRIAYTLRQTLELAGVENNNTYRLVHGEGDNLPGLVIDMYAHTAVMQAHSVGMHYARHQIAEALKAVLGDSLQNIYYKSEATLPYKANLGSEDGYLYGGEVEDIALENGLKFCVDWQKGQKTGFFVDQRENRSLLERYAKGRSVLNMLHWRLLVLRHAGRSQGRSLGRQLCQSDLADQQERGIELSRRSAPRSLCGRRFQISRKDGKQLRSHHPGSTSFRQT